MVQPGIQRKPYIWVNTPISDRLVKRFDLLDVPRDPDNFLMSRTIQPVTVVDEVLKATKSGRIGVVERTSVAGAGTFLAYTVPKGKRQTFYILSFSTISGDGTLSAISVSDNPTYLQLIYTVAPATNIATGILAVPITLDAGQFIYVACAVISTNSSWNIQAHYTEEDSFRA